MALEGHLRNGLFGLARAEAARGAPSRSRGRPYLLGRMCGSLAGRDRGIVALPQFLVIGAYKSGTTSIHEVLRQHPSVFVPNRKEPNFFAFDGDPCPDLRVAARSVTDRNDYEALFAPARPGQLLGEVSPEYLVNEWAPRRIKELVPDARLVAVVRNPVDRAWSDFLMYRRDGVEAATDFLDAIRQQDERRAANAPGASYLRSGRYGEQLARYYRRFDREQLLVLLFEDLVAAPEHSLELLWRFLQLPVVDGLRLPQTNISGIPRNRIVANLYRARRVVGPAAKRALPPPLQRRLERLASRGLVRDTLPADVRAEVLEHFRSDIALLGELIGQDLSTRWR